MIFGLNTSDPLPGWAVALILCAVLAAILILIKFNGWSDVSDRYPSARPFPKKPVTGLRGNPFYRNSAVLKIRKGRTGSDIGLHACADETGLYFEPMLIFKIVHRAAFIPWPDVTGDLYKLPIPSFMGRMFQPPVLVRFKRAPGVELQMTQDVVKQLKAQSNGAWKGADA